MKGTVRYLSGIKDEPSKTSRLKFFISLRQNIKKCTSSLINPIQLLPCSLPPTICLDFITHKGAVWEKAGLAELGYLAKTVMSRHERKALSITAWTYHPLLPLPRPPPCSAVPMWMTPEPFLMFGLTCRWLARVCDSGDRRGCSFLNTMSETRRQEAGMCSVLSAAPGSRWLIF